MDEPAVTLTDYALTVLCGTLVVRLRLGPRLGRAHGWLQLFFAAAGLAPLLGGTVHGFFPDPATAGYRSLWPATLMAIGVAALAACGLAASLVLAPRPARVLSSVAFAAWLGFAAAVLGGWHDFRIAVAFYLPAVVGLLIAVLRAQRGGARPGLRQAAAGLALTLVAAALQQAGVGLHPTWFDHNAVYHVLQAVALLLFYRGMRRALLTDAEPLARLAAS